MKSFHIKINDLRAEVIVPLSSILYILYEYDPTRANPLSKDYDPKRPWGHAVHFFCRENKRFGELYATEEAAKRRMKQYMRAIEGRELTEEEDGGFAVES